MTGSPGVSLRSEMGRETYVAVNDSVVGIKINGIQDKDMRAHFTSRFKAVSASIECVAHLSFSLGGCLTLVLLLCVSSVHALNITCLQLTTLRS
jgi:hypothetical protein